MGSENCAQAQALALAGMTLFGGGRPLLHSVLAREREYTIVYRVSLELLGVRSHIAAQCNKNDDPKNSKKFVAARAACCRCRLP